jgi:branched-subunit amino acid aminotransferase/4-amino-4-deoxychorismate lyase
MSTTTNTQGGTAPFIELNGAVPLVEDVLALALYNYGCYTSFVVDRGGARGLDLHLERLRRDCRQLFGIDANTDEVRRLVARTAHAVPAPYIARVTLFDAGFALAKPSRVLDDVDVLITTRPFHALSDEPLRLTAHMYIDPDPHMKHAGLFGALQQRAHAQRQGFDDCVFVGEGGVIHEGPTWNVIVAHGDRLTTPASNALAGTTLQLLRTSLASTGRTIRDESIVLDDLDGDSAAFAVNVAGIRPIAAIDGRALRVDDAVCAELRAALEEVVATPLVD